MTFQHTHTHILYLKPNQLDGLFSDQAHQVLPIKKVKVFISITSLQIVFTIKEKVNFFELHKPDELKNVFLGFFILVQFYMPLREPWTRESTFHCETITSHCGFFSVNTRACYSICLFHVWLSPSFHTILSAVLLFSFDKQPTFCEALQVQFAWFTGLLFIYNSTTHREPLILRKYQFTTTCTAYCGIKY